MLPSKSAQLIKSRKRALFCSNWLAITPTSSLVISSLKHLIISHFMGPTAHIRAKERLHAKLAW